MIKKELTEALPEFMDEFAWEIVAVCVEEKLFPGVERVAAALAEELSLAVDAYQEKGADSDEAIDWLWHEGYDEMCLTDKVVDRLRSSMKKSGVTEDPEGRKYWKQLDQGCE